MQLSRFVALLVSLTLKVWLCRDGLFLDFWNDSVDADMNRPYEQFPFRPLQVDHIIFLR